MTVAHEFRSVSIRAELPTDLLSIREVIEAAFSRRDEADLVDRLREEGMTIHSLVATDEGEIVGHILFSHVWIDGEPPAALASLAPVAVRPDRQRRGIGPALIANGIEACRADGWTGIIVVGSPSYYTRFRFSSAVVAHLASPYAGEAFMGLELLPGAIKRLRGCVRYPNAFQPFS